MLWGGGGGYLVDVVQSVSVLHHRGGMGALMTRVMRASDLYTHTHTGMDAVCLRPGQK